ncbi:unnamed protein product [Lampetra fluviatilis]
MSEGVRGCGEEEEEEGKERASVVSDRHATPGTMSYAGPHRYANFNVHKFGGSTHRALSRAVLRPRFWSPRVPSRREVGSGGTRSASERSVDALKTRIQGTTTFNVSPIVIRSSPMTMGDERRAGRRRRSF